MAQILRSSGGEVIITKDRDLRAPGKPKAKKAETYTVENFLSGSVPDRITFELQERFRDKAMRELLAQTEVSGTINVADEEERGPSGYINVGIPEQAEGGVGIEESLFLTVVVKHRRFRPRISKDIVDTEFTEFI